MKYLLYKRFPLLMHPLQVHGLDQGTGKLGEPLALFLWKKNKKRAELEPCICFFWSDDDDDMHAMQGV